MEFKGGVKLRRKNMAWNIIENWVLKVQKPEKIGRLNLEVSLI